MADESSGVFYIKDKSIVEIADIIRDLTKSNKKMDIDSIIKSISADSLEQKILKSFLEGKTIFSDDELEESYENKKNFTQDLTLLKPYQFYKCSNKIPNHFFNEKDLIFGKRSCYNVTNLTTLECPEATVVQNSIEGGTDERGSEAFKNCYDLTTVSLPNAKEIPIRCFHYDRSLKTVDIQKATYVGTSAFSNCTKLEEINCSNLKKIAQWGFYNCSSLKEIRGPFTKIGARAFEGCKSLKKIELQDSANSICAIIPGYDSSTLENFYDHFKGTSSDLKIITQSASNWSAYCKSFSWQQALDITNQAVDNHNNLPANPTFEQMAQVFRIKDQENLNSMSCYITFEKKDYDYNIHIIYKDSNDQIQTEQINVSETHKIKLDIKICSEIAIGIDNQTISIVSSNRNLQKKTTIDYFPQSLLQDGYTYQNIFFPVISDFEATVSTPSGTGDNEYYKIIFDSDMSDDYIRVNFTDPQGGSMTRELSGSGTIAIKPNSNLDLTYYNYYDYPIRSLRIEPAGGYDYYNIISNHNADIYNISGDLTIYINK